MGAFDGRRPSTSRLMVLPSRQAEGGKEEQEVEAKLRMGGHSSNAPLQEDTGVDPVLRSHHSRLRGIIGRDLVSVLCSHFFPTWSRSFSHIFFQSWCWRELSS